MAYQERSWLLGRGCCSPRIRPRHLAGPLWSTLVSLRAPIGYENPCRGPRGQRSVSQDGNHVARPLRDCVSIWLPRPSSCQRPVRAARVLLPVLGGGGPERSRDEGRCTDTRRPSPKDGVAISRISHPPLGVGRPYADLSIPRRAWGRNDAKALRRLISCGTPRIWWVLSSLPRSPSGGSQCRSRPWPTDCGTPPG